MAHSNHLFSHCCSTPMEPILSDGWVPSLQKRGVRKPGLPRGTKTHSVPISFGWLGPLDTALGNQSGWYFGTGIPRCSLRVASFGEGSNGQGILGCPGRLEGRYVFGRVGRTGNRNGVPPGTTVRGLGRLRAERSGRSGWLLDLPFGVHPTSGPGWQADQGVKRV
jgi:hypothetical protein